MFSFFKKDPLKQLNKQYSAKLEQAMISQRNGDIKGYSPLKQSKYSIKLKSLKVKYLKYRTLSVSLVFDNNTSLRCCYQACTIENFKTLK
ncbi:DUF6435 family protein [Pseudoalteromonas prydzensis]|uniref:DUF6435 family protein n=1 Tax=Pseudoalteromonas prydzensis TaxID=182141 RepID=UPI00321A65FF